MYENLEKLNLNHTQKIKYNKIPRKISVQAIYIKYSRTTLRSYENFRIDRRKLILH
jgi:hypothetical protein